MERRERGMERRERRTEPPECGRAIRESERRKSVPTANKSAKR